MQKEITEFMKTDSEAKKLAKLVKKTNPEKPKRRVNPLLDKFKKMTKK